MDRELVETFLAIVEHKTISGAADTLYVSQSTVSHRVACLEDYIGCVLFERQRGIKSVKLTRAGESFIPLAHHWLDVDDSIRELKSANIHRKIYIAGMDSVNQFLLASIFSRIRLYEPNLQMELFTYHSKEIYKKLNSHEVDIGFAYFPIHYSDIIAAPVFREPIMMISSPESIYSEKVIHPSTLRKSDEVLYSWDARLMQWHDEWWPQYEAPYVKVDSCGLLQNFFLSESSWAMCPASVATELFSLGMVKKHDFAIAPPDRICYMLTRKPPKNGSDESVDCFLEIFYRLLENHPWKYTNKDIR